jgi:bifunctional pyridoxal-dependent enzyme with beta-cystathionase and maltose regulon repressor activities
VEKSATLLEQMEARSKKSDRDTRTQVLIAVCAVATSAFLSLFSFIQDKNNYETGDRWQRELLDSLRQNNQVRNRTREEIQLLKHDAAVLRAQLKAAKGSASKDQQGNQ